jgi:hypothetical protein
MNYETTSPSRSLQATVECTSSLETLRAVIDSSPFSGEIAVLAAATSPSGYAWYDIETHSRDAVGAMKAMRGALELLLAASRESILADFRIVVGGAYVVASERSESDPAPFAGAMFAV